MRLSLIYTERKGNLFSWCIKKVLKTKYSHVALQLSDIYGNHVYQASVTGVNHISEKSFLQKNTIVYKKSITINEETYTKIKEFCLQMLGRSYSFLAILGIFVDLCLGVKNKIGKDGARTYICSEFAAHALKIAIPFKSEDIDQLDPKELYALTRSIT